MNRILLFMGGLLNLSGPLQDRHALPLPLDGNDGFGRSVHVMWSTVYAENLGISLLLLFFAYMSFFQWRELREIGLGKIVLLSIGTLWVFRTAAEIFLLPLARAVWSRSSQPKALAL